MATDFEQLFLAQSSHVLHISGRASLFIEDVAGAIFAIFAEGGHCVPVLRHNCYGSAAAKGARKVMDVSSSV